jgi:hypothetical protein
VPDSQAPGQMLIRIAFDAGPLGGAMQIERRIEVQ